MKTLISVTSTEEAKKAVELYCDILDIKDPQEGSLGAPNPFLVEEIKELNTTKIPISIAIGDVPFLPNTIAFAVLGASVFKPDYIKIGLKGISTQNEALSMMNLAKKILKKYSPETSLVAGCYADYSTANSIIPLELIGALDNQIIDVCLIDTLSKEEKSLFNYMSNNDLNNFVDCCIGKSIKVALAGNLRISDFSKLKEFRVDVIGVRGAVCKSNCRHNTIDSQLLKSFINEARK